jgi:hypothetical protein
VERPTKLGAVVYLLGCHSGVCDDGVFRLGPEHRGGAAGVSELEGAEGGRAVSSDLGAVGNDVPGSGRECMVHPPDGQPFPCDDLYYCNFLWNVVNDLNRAWTYNLNMSTQ